MIVSAFARGYGLVWAVPAAVLAAAPLTAGCAAARQNAAPATAPASAGENAGLPTWFVEREGKLAAMGKPDLAAVPQAQTADTEGLKARLDRMEAELRRAHLDLVADPRAALAPDAASASAFDVSARDQVENARR